MRMMAALMMATLAGVLIGIALMNNRHQADEAGMREALLVCAYVMVMERDDGKVGTFTHDGVLLLNAMHKSCERYNVYDPLAKRVTSPEGQP